MTTGYYIWFIIALLLAGGEILTGTLYLLVVAISVAAGGLANLLGIGIPNSLIITALVSITLFIILKRIRKRQYIKTNSNQSLDIGQLVHILSWQDSKHARIQYRGTQWDAELIEDNLHQVTATYEIAGQRGNIFLIRIKK